MNTTQITRSEILEILATYEEMLRREWRPELLAIWTNWKAHLAAS